MYDRGPGLSVWDRRTHADEDRPDGHDESQSFESKEVDHRRSNVHR